MVELEKRWAKRHSARKMAQQELKPHLDKDKKATLVYEAIVTDGEYPYRQCFLRSIEWMTPRAAWNSPSFVGTRRSIRMARNIRQSLTASRFKPGESNR
jgi:hypothetical protein